MSTVTLERPSRTTSELIPAVRAELRARRAPRPDFAGSRRMLVAVPSGSPTDDRDIRRDAPATAEARS